MAEKCCPFANNCCYHTAVRAVAVPDDGCYLYRYFKKLIDSDEYDRGYEKGMKDAWEVARKCILDPKDGGLTLEELMEIFGENAYSYTLHKIAKMYTASEAKQKIDDYIKKQDEELHVGDEVIGFADCKSIIISEPTRYNTIQVLTIAALYSLEVPMASLKKTGRHFDEVEKLLKKLKEA